MTYTTIKHYRWWKFLYRVFGLLPYHILGKAVKDKPRMKFFTMYENAKTGMRYLVDNDTGKIFGDRI